MSEQSYGEMMDDVFQTIRDQAARIEALEAALREIANNVDFPSGAECRAIARAALDKDDGK